MSRKRTSTLMSAIAWLTCALASNGASSAITLSALMPIEAIYTGPNGNFLLIMEASNPACGSSGNQFNVYIGQVGMTADGAKAALAAVLTAYALDKPIRVYFDPAIAGCPVQQVSLIP